MPLFDFLKKKNGDFYAWLEEASDISVQAAHVLRDLCYNFNNPQEAAVRLHDLEHKGDDIGHLIYSELNNTFVTPIDREDIIALYSALDDMIDYIHSSADMMAVYKVESVPHTAQGLADCIVGCAEELSKAIPRLRKRAEMKGMQEGVIRVHTLENQADDLLRAGLGELFSDPRDVMHVIKWRDIYAEMELATDTAEDVADVLRGLAIKHA